MDSIHNLTPEQRERLSGLAVNYNTLCLVDLVTKQMEVIKTEKYVTEYYGIPRYDGLTTLDVFLPFVSSDCLELVTDYINTDKVAEKLSKANSIAPITFTNIRMGGVLRSMQWRIANRNEKGEAIRAFFIATELDAMKYRQEHLLKEVYDTVDAASMGIWGIESFEDEKPRMRASSTMLRLLGLDPTLRYSEEQIFEAFDTGLCPESHPAIDCYFENMKSGNRDEITYVWNHPELGKRYVRCGGMGYRVPGKGYSFMGYHYDVTDMVKAEMEREVVIKALADTYSALYYIDIPKDSYSLYSSSPLRRSKVIHNTGTLSDGMDSVCNDFVCPEHLERMRAFVDVNTLNDRVRNRNKIFTQFQSYDKVWYECFLAVCERDANENPVRVILGFRDINNEKNNEKRLLEELSQSKTLISTKTTMLQNMSHEIRTPLNAMFGFSQILGLPDDLVSQKEREQYVDYITNSFNMLTMLIDDVLSISDEEHGNLFIVSEDVNVNDICRSSIQIIEIRKPEDVMLYFTSEAPDDYVVKSDGRRIQQILINYLTNACKHTTEGEIHLHLSMSENPGHLTFSVTDTGTGIPPEMAQDIFLRFKKLDKSVHGSGLGLNICSVIAEKLHGEVRLDTSYTDGARFLFIL